MSINNIFEVAGQGMTAQSIRLNTTASNLANANSASSSVDQTYRALHPVFATYREGIMAGDSSMFTASQDEASVGVRVMGIVQSQDELKRQYEPGNPMADEEGYVYYPNVNVVEEMANMISASRSFQMNVELMNSAKSMVQRLLTIGQ